MRFEKLPSSTIRFTIMINGKRFTSATKVRAKNWNKDEQLASGSGSILINNELQRIREGVELWMSQTPINNYTPELISHYLKSIILNQTHTERRKSISQYFEDFLLEKTIEVNPITSKRISKGTIRTYRTAFAHFKEFRDLELENINKVNYHAFISHLLSRYKPNTVGKTIRRLKTFFFWVKSNNLPISSEFVYWKALNEDTQKDTRALNSEQMDRIYKLEVDPVEVFRIAKEVYNKHLDSKQVNDLCKSIKEAANDAVAIASTGPHVDDFYKLTDKNIQGNIIVTKRGKNHQEFIAPFVDNKNWHAKELANLDGGFLFKRKTNLNYYLSYLEYLCNLPFKVTASSFRKTFGSILYFESDHPNRLITIMDAYGHKEEKTTRKYLGIQKTDRERDHSEMFL